MNWQCHMCDAMKIKLDQVRHGFLSRFHSMEITPFSSHNQQTLIYSHVSHSRIRLSAILIADYGNIVNNFPVGVFESKSRAASSFRAECKPLEFGTW